MISPSKEAIAEAYAKLPEPELPDTGTKSCMNCGRERDLEKYDVDNSKSDGRRDTCKDCRSQTRSDRWRKRVDRRIQKMDKEALKALDDLTRPNNIRRSFSTPHLANLMQDVITIFGGTRSYAQHLLAQFLSANPGSQTRTRILEMIERMVREASKEGYVERPLNELTDTELEKLYDERKARMAGKLGLTVAPANESVGITYDSRERAS